MEISERLKGVREGIRNGRLKFAAEEVRELKKALRVRDGGDVADESEREREPVVYGLLKKEWSDCFEEVWISKSFFFWLGSVWLPIMSRESEKKGTE